MCGYVAEHHDSGKSDIAAALPDVVYHSCYPSGIHDELTELWGMLGYLPDQRSCVLDHKLIAILK